MSVTLSRATLETTLEEVSRIYFSNRRTLRAETKKAEELDAAFRRGIAEGVANFLYLHRCTSLPRFKTLPPIYESDVRAILDPVASDWNNSLPNEKGIICDGIVDALLALAVPQDLIKTDEEERRRLILKGDEKARPEDAEWIGEMAEAKRREVEELMELLKPVGWEKVNDATPQTKYPRTEPRCAGMCDKVLSQFGTKEGYADHLRREHSMPFSEASQYAVGGWSRLTTYMQYKEREENPLIIRPVGGDAMSQITEALTTSPSYIDSGGPTRVLKDNPQA